MSLWTQRDRFGQIKERGPSLARITLTSIFALIQPGTYTHLWLGMAHWSNFLKLGKCLNSLTSQHFECWYLHILTSQLQWHSDMGSEGRLKWSCNSTSVDKMPFCQPNPSESLLLSFPITIQADGTKSATGIRSTKRMVWVLYFSKMKSKREILYTNKNHQRLWNNVQLLYILKVYWNIEHVHLCACDCAKSSILSLLLSIHGQEEQFL